MANDVAHFAIHADDCERARRFYGSVFGWTFEAWGPPGFWRVFTGGGIEGALHERLEPVSGTGMIGYECSIAVEDVHAIEGAIRDHGGEILRPPMRIEGVGTVLQFRDTEGNVAQAMQYADGVRQ
ncbi:MAG: VOC family protein [Planctomycetota bacterium]